MCEARVMTSERERLLLHESFLKGAAGSTGLPEPASLAADNHNVNTGQRAFNLFGLSFHKHTGIHVDTPFDVSEDALTVDQITVGNLIVPLCGVDVVERAQDDPDTPVTHYGLKVWTDRHLLVSPLAREVQW